MIHAVMAYELMTYVVMTCELMTYAVMTLGRATPYQYSIYNIQLENVNL